MIESPAVALVATGAVALAITLALVPLLRLAALRVGLVDRPDGRRKLKTRAVPKAGGLAVLCATLLTLALIAAFRPEVVAALSGDGRFWSLFAAASFIGLVGLADDFRGLRGRHKLVGQLIAVSILIFPGGLYVGSVRLFGLEVELGALGLVFTAFWLLGCINALNLIDGMDGLL